MSETPTTTTSQKSVAIRPQFILQYAPNLYCTAFGATEFPGKGNSSVLPPFVLQYASHLYRSTSPSCIAILLGKSWWLWSPGCSPITSWKYWPKNGPRPKWQKKAKNRNMMYFLFFFFVPFLGHFFPISGRGPL